MPSKYISPWPKADELRRRADMAGRNPSKQPKPPPKTKPKQYLVLGLEVDYETYRKYNYECNWTIDGDVLKDITCSLWSLERYATEEYAKEYPIEAANARKILEQIRKEIAAINRKDENNMSRPQNAAGFIDALSQIYTESRSAYDALQEKVNKAQAKMNRAKEEMQNPEYNKQMAEANYTIALGEYRLAVTEFRNGHRSMHNDHEMKVKELRGQFAEYLEEHYSASPDKLDAATMHLLNSGICTPSELARLVDRHTDNPTMLRIIGNYAWNMRQEKGKSMSYEDSLICTNVAAAGAAAKDGSRELAIFDSAVSTTAYGLGEDYNHATRMHGHVSGWLNDFKNNITNLPNIPAETAEGVPVAE